MPEQRKRMRAVVMRPQSLTVEQRPIPSPGPGQVLVKTLACGICGSDLHLFRHARDYYDQGLRAGMSPEILDKGVVLGHEFVAQIVEFGPATRQQLAIGDRVCCVPFISGELAQVPIGATPLVDGAYAEYLVLTEDYLLPVPENLSDEGAALTEPLAIGMHAVNSSQLETQTALVIGCGPIGLAVIAALTLTGQRQIIASDLSDFRLDLARRTGAHVVVNAATGSPFEQARTDAATPLVIYECTGVAGMLGQCIDQAPRGSEIVIAGISHGQEAITPATAVSKELTLRFVSFYAQEEFATALRTLAADRVNWRPWITDRIGLEGTAAAFDALARSDDQAKILIHPHS